MGARSRKAPKTTIASFGSSVATRQQIPLKSDLITPPLGIKVKEQHLVGDGSHTTAVAKKL